jgi:hypothetical protein
LAALGVLRASSSFICAKFFPALPRHKFAKWTQAVPDCSLPEPRPPCAQPVRITVPGYWHYAAGREQSARIERVLMLTRLVLEFQAHGFDFVWRQWHGDQPDRQ